VTVQKYAKEAHTFNMDGRTHEAGVNLDVGDIKGQHDCTHHDDEAYHAGQRDSTRQEPPP
jgi:hypothetical protein